MIHPTIGRRVWYWPSPQDRGETEYPPRSLILHADQSQPCDAGICYVWGDRTVNLTVADQNGVMHSRTSVQLLQEGDPRPEHGGFCEWMPYQVKAAVQAA